MTGGRHARHALIDWFDQDTLKQLRIVVVGAGAVGNEVLKNLALLGVGQIDVHDLDTIEVHNLTRSVLFREGDVGQPKATCAAARARELDPSVGVTPFVGDFWRTLKLAEVANASVVFCCVDNFEARIRLNRLCAIARTPLLNIGIDSRFAVVEHFPFSGVHSGPCYECALPAAVYAALSRRYSCGWLRRVAVAEKKVPTTILTSSAAASLAISVYLRSLHDATEPAATRYFEDTATGATTRGGIAQLEGCPGCSDLQDDRVIVRASRRIDGRLVDLLGVAALGQVVFSDRVLVHLRCPACEADQPPVVVFASADRYDDTIARCPACGTAREIELRDQFSAAELLRDYRNHDLPGKFLVSCLEDGPQVFVELEGDDA